MKSKAVRNILQLVVSALLCASTFAFSAPADLDPAFGDGGVARLPNASRVDGGALFPDGGIALLVDRPANPDPRDIVVRLDLLGRMDAAFTPIAPLPAPTPSDGDIRILSIAVTRTGHVITLQESFPFPVCRNWVTRHLPSGAADAAFGQLGVTRALPG